MAKLYPPVIEGTIPAFYGTTLVVPFSMNRSVGKTDIKGFSLKIKTIQSNTFVANVTSTNYTTSEVSFDISNLQLTEGQSYKLQLAYVADDNYSTISYYSSVGVVKYYGKEGPLTYIDGISNTKSNFYTGYYVGVFEHPQEPLEKVSQYRFIITSVDGEIEDDTGWLSHNTINDVNSISSNDIYRNSNELDENTFYFLQYKVITSNKMECSSPKYRIMQRKSVPTVLDITLEAKNNYDDGYTAIQINGAPDISLTGSFEISRQNIKTPKRWDPIFVFVLQSEAPLKRVWRDFTTEQGNTYRYGIRQFNDAGIYSERILSEDVLVDFEDAYLFDGKRQLKIKYNPKVSSFKNDILENKVDTIGSKYPFIFRNGHVNYKEFPISGLISYWSDDQELFMTNDDIGIFDPDKLSRKSTPEKEEWPSNLKTKDLLDYNIAAERNFKLEALEWLTDGKPKLFRSPGEGNYIVRLLNTSLTPNDTVGRMLHTFNCTAYEVDEINYANLSKYGFIKSYLTDDETNYIFYRSIKLFDIINGEKSPYIADKDGYIELLTDPYDPVGAPINALTIKFEDMSSGDIVYVDGEKRIIGNTGVYNVDDGNIVTSVKIKAQPVPYFHEDEYNAAIEAYNEAIDNYNTYVRQINILEEEIIALEEDTNIRYTDEQYDNLIEWYKQLVSIQNELNNAIDKYNYYNDNVSNLFEILSNLNQQIFDLGTENAQLNTSVENYEEEANRAYANYQVYDDLYQQYMISDPSRAEIYRVQRDEYFNNYKTAINNKTNTLAQIEENTNRINSLQKDVTFYQNLLDENQSTANTWNTIKNNKTTAINTLKDNIRSIIISPDILRNEYAAAVVYYTELKNKTEAIEFKTNLIESLTEQRDIAEEAIPFKPLKQDYYYSSKNNILNDYEGVFTYSYMDRFTNSFDLITKQELLEIPCKQIIGGETTNNVFPELSDAKQELLGIQQFHAELKQIENIYVLPSMANALIRENGYIDEETLKNNFSLNRVDILKEDDLNLVKSSIYVYQILPVLTHDTKNTYGDNGGVLFGFISNEDFNATDRYWDITGYYDGSRTPIMNNNYKMIAVASNEEQANWHTPMFMREYGNSDEYYAIQFFSASEFYDFIDSEVKKQKKDENGNFILDENGNAVYTYEIFTRNDGSQVAWDNPVYTEGTIYYTKGIRYVHVTYHKNENHYTDGNYYRIVKDPVNEGIYYLDLFNPYYKFENEELNGYFLVYDDKEKKFRVTKGYSNKVYINTGVTNAIVGADGDLYDKFGDKVEPYIDLSITQEFNTELIPEVTDIYVGNGVILNITYQIRNVSYSVEVDNRSIDKARKNWEDALSAYRQQFYTRIDINTVEYNDDYWDFSRDDINERIRNFEEFRLASKKAYKEYIIEVNRALKEYKAQRSWTDYQEVINNE